MTSSLASLRSVERRVLSTVSRHAAAISFSRLSAKLRFAERLGADDETRTRDIDLGKVALYQLSYIRMPPGP